MPALTWDSCQELLHTGLLCKNDLDEVVDAGCMRRNPDVIGHRYIEEAVNGADVPHAQDIQGQVCWGHRQTLHNRLGKLCMSLGTPVLDLPGVCLILDRQALHSRLTKLCMSNGIPVSWPARHLLDLLGPAQLAS